MVKAWLGELWRAATVRNPRVARRPGPARRVRLGLEALEDRTVPTVILPGPRWNGIAYNGSAPPRTYPDTTVTDSPTRVLEGVNTQFSLYDKSGSGVALANTTMQAFFGLLPGTVVWDPLVTYNDNTGRMIAIGLTRFIGVAPIPSTSTLLVRVANVVNPNNLTTNWGPVNAIQVDQGVFRAGSTGPISYAEQAYLGFNADAITVSLDMHDLGTGQYDHTQIVFLTNGGGFLSRLTSPAPPNNAANAPPYPWIAMVPARMHAATVGGPQYIMSEWLTPPPVPTLPLPANNNIAVWRILNPAVPVLNFLVPTAVVTEFLGYVRGPTPLVPNSANAAGGAIGVVNVGDTRIQSVAWRSELLVATHQATIAGVVKVRWMIIFTQPAVPTLSMLGTIDPGAGLFAYLPSLDIAPNLDIGIQYIVSSATLPMTIFATGRQLTDPANTMQTPVILASGPLPLFDSGNVPPRAGRYSGCAWDVGTNCFWGANEYTNLAVPNNWQTFVFEFCLGIIPQPNVPVPLPNGPPGQLFPPNPLRIYSPLRWVQQPNGTETGTITLINYGPTRTGPFLITLRFPDSTVRLLNPTSTQTGRIATILFFTPLTYNVPVRITLTVRNPRHLPLGTFYVGIAVKIR